MTRLWLGLVAAVCLAACETAALSGAPVPDAARDREPSNYTPGIHISGHAIIGVKRSF